MKGICRITGVLKPPARRFQTHHHREGVAWHCTPSLSGSRDDLSGSPGHSLYHCHFSCRLVLMVSMSTRESPQPVLPCGKAHTPSSLLCLEAGKADSLGRHGTTAVLLSRALLVPNCFCAKPCAQTWQGRGSPDPLGELSAQGGEVGTWPSMPALAA